jgi:hypothetical protein
MNQYPKHTVPASLIGLVAGALLGIATNSAMAFWLGVIVVGGVALAFLKETDKD